MHDPVLKQEFLESFSNVELGVFVDGTLGAGGHAQALCEAHPELKKYIGIDQDELAHSLSREKLKLYSCKLNLFQNNFSKFLSCLKEINVEGVDGIFLDLGVSSMQIDRSYRGFSFQKEGPLDMRMNPSQTLTAKDIVMNWSEKELERIFREYGEETRCRVMAKAIVEHRRKNSLDTTQELVELLYPLAFKKRSIHPLTLVFQALRIAVNSELQVLYETLPLMIDSLNSKGRLGVISYHSLEDRIVKECFRNYALVKDPVTGKKKEPLIS